MKKNEVATFSCSATGTGDLSIEWDVGGVLYDHVRCFESPNCESITDNEINQHRFLTSVLRITGVNSLEISCIVNQNLTISSQVISGVEIRQPPSTYMRTIQETAQLTVIPAGGINMWLLGCIKSTYCISFV